MATPVFFGAQPTLNTGLTGVNVVQPSIFGNTGFYGAQPTYNTGLTGFYGAQPTYLNNPNPSTVNTLAQYYQQFPQQLSAAELLELQNLRNLADSEIPFIDNNQQYQQYLLQQQLNNQNPLTVNTLDNNQQYQQYQQYLLQLQQQTSPINYLNNQNPLTVNTAQQFSQQLSAAQLLELQNLRNLANSEFPQPAAGNYANYDLNPYQFTNPYPQSFGECSQTNQAACFAYQTNQGASPTDSQPPTGLTLSALLQAFNSPIGLGRWAIFKFTIPVMPWEVSDVQQELLQARTSIEVCVPDCNSAIPLLVSHNCVQVRSNTMMFGICDLQIYI